MAEITTTITISSKSKEGTIKDFPTTLKPEVPRMVTISWLVGGVNYLEKLTETNILLFLSKPVLIGLSPG